MRNDAITSPNPANSTGLLRSFIAAACAGSPHLLHVLHAVQQQFLHISYQAAHEVATQLSVPLSQVEAVIGFYSFLRRTPRGRFDILFSNCTSC